MIDYAQAKSIAQVLSALAEATRMHVVELLCQQDHNVSELAQAVNIPIVNMSHHLGVLRQAKLVQDERDGRKKIYTLGRDYFVRQDKQPCMLKIENWKIEIVGFDHVKE
jgi:DNA-binding transcriptional ArsR family regulator